jgi:hypothetical protein
MGQQLRLTREGETQAVFAALDAKGHFSFGDLRPGTYRLSGGSFSHGAAYIKSFLVDGKATENREVTLLPGQSADVQIRVSNDPVRAENHQPAGDSPPHYQPAGTHPSASLWGKVTGLAASAAQVDLRAIRLNSARSMIYETATSSDGSFRFEAIDPGIYVLAIHGTDDQYSAFGAKGPGLEGMPIKLTAGQHRDDIIIPSFRKNLLNRLAGDGQSAYHVRGAVQGTLDSAVGDRFYVKLLPDVPYSPPTALVGQVGENGDFDVSDVRPGRYTLTITSTFARFEGPIMCSGPMGAPCYSGLEHVLAAQAISVGPADLNDVSVKPHALAKLTGEVLLDGKALDPTKKWNWTPTLAKQFRNQAPATAPPSLDGHFSMDSLDDGEYRFDGFWPEYYIQSISLDSKPIEGRTFELHFDQSVHLTVRLATDGASGWLNSEPADPPVDPYRDFCRSFEGGATIRMLIPDPLPSDNSGILHGFYSAAGKQMIQSVPPGRYRFVAAENFSLSHRFRRGTGNDLFQNHEFMMKLAALGRPVEIAPKQSFDLTAPVVTEGLQRLLAELGVPAEHEN